MIRLNKIQFFLTGLMVILLCYFIRQLTFISNSERATGEVIRITQGGGKGTKITYPVVKFHTDKYEFTFVAEGNLEYQRGDKVEVIYDKNDPGDASIFTFFGFWFGRAVWFGLALMLWAAFSTSYIGTGEYISLNFRDRVFGKTNDRKDIRDKEFPFNDRMKLE